MINTISMRRMQMAGAAGAILIAGFSLSERAGAGSGAGYGTSVTPRPDGGSAKTSTRGAGSECAVFSKEGALMCTRTFSITSHAAAVARCVALKC